MKWYQRDANNRYDPKMIMLFDRYKSEGRDLYWVVLDMIAEKLDGRHFTFCLEENTQLLAKVMEITVEKVDSILNYCVELGLLDREPQTKRIRALKIMSRLDTTTSRLPQIKTLIEHAKRFEETSNKLRSPTDLLTNKDTDLQALSAIENTQGYKFPSAQEIFEAEQRKRKA